MMLARLFLIVALQALFSSQLLVAASDPPLTLLPPQGQSQNQQSIPQSLPENEELHDIYGPVHLDEPIPSFLLGAGLVLIAILLLFLLWYFKRKKKPAIPPVPPWETAKLELERIKPFLNPVSSILYLDKASQILRRYIESRFAAKSTRQTTREFLSNLEAATDNTPLQEFKAELQECLQRADMAKFAQHSADQPELQKVEEAIVLFIEQTTPSETPGGATS